MRAQVRVPILVAIAIAFPVYVHASDHWAPLFTTPFSGQIVDHVGFDNNDPNHPHLTPPTNTSVTLLTVDGLNAGDAILVRGADGNDYLRHVATITPDQNTPPTSYLVTWDQPLPVIAASNSLLRSSFSINPDDVTACLDPSVPCRLLPQSPKQSAIDQNGTVYVIDYFNNRVVAVDSRGSALWEIGGYVHIYDDAHMNLFGASDTWGFGCDNDPNAPANNAPCPNNIQAGLGKFWNPLGIDVSPDGKTLIVSDYWNHRIQVFVRDDVNGTLTPLALNINPASLPKFTAYAIGGYGVNAGQLRSPAGAGINANGQIVVADQYNNRVEVFTPTAPGSHQYTAIAFGSVGSGLPTDAASPGIYFQGLDGAKWDRSIGTPTSGRIVVADTDNHRVQVFDATGHFLTVLGYFDPNLGAYAPTDALGGFSGPEGIAVDDAGRIYVADLYNSRVDSFIAAAGNTYTFESTFGSNQANNFAGLLPLISPTGLSYSSGRLTITEQGGQRVQRLGKTGLAIDSLTTSLPPGQTALQPDDDTKNVIDGNVVIRNTGGLPLTGVTVTATASHGGPFLQPPTSASSFLAASGNPGDTLTFHFQFRVTNIDDGAPTLSFTFNATGMSGPVMINAARTIDSGVAVNRPAGPALSIDQISALHIDPVTLVGSNRAGVGDVITVTVPTHNIGGVSLTGVATTVTPSSRGLVTLTATSHAVTNVSPDGTTSLNRDARDTVIFAFRAVAVGTVTFTARATANELPGDAASAPNSASVSILSDSQAPSVQISISPVPSEPSGYGNSWYNGAPGPCTNAGGCPARLVDAITHQQVVTWPTITVTATDDQALKAINWRMIKTSLDQSDQFGTCLAASPAPTLPSTCVAGPANSVIWQRRMEGLQNRSVIVFWAEDEAGNGAAVTDSHTCDAAPESQLVTPITLASGVTVVCVNVHIDVDPPTINQGTTTFNADNTGVTIGLTGVDQYSLVGRMFSADSEYHVLTRNTGNLVMHAEGATIAGSMTAVDFARNPATFSVPLPAMPPIRLDHTPPEAFNRLDPNTLGKRCWTTINNQPVSYFCTNKVYGTDNLPGFPTTAFAPVSVVPTKWGGYWSDPDDDDRDWDGDNDAELHTYTFSDDYTPGTGLKPQQNANRVTLVERVRQNGQEARIRVVSFQYQVGSNPSTLKPIVYPDSAYKKYEWSIDDDDDDADGGLRMLNQKFELGHGQTYVTVEAKFDARKKITLIKRRGAGTSPVDVTAVGLILLRMTTASGLLAIDWDVNHPVPVPDIAAPKLTVPGPIVVEATSASGRMVAFNASALDIVDGVTPAYCTPGSGQTFPLGTRTVSCNATDTSGNVAQKTFTVTVRDTTKPVLTVPADITVNATQLGGAIVTFRATATDSVDPSVPVLCSAASGSLFRVGTTMIACAGADDSGNIAMGTFRVTVKDPVAPTLTLPGTITVSTTSASGVNVTFTATAVDLVDGVRPVQCSPASGSKFKAGATTVTCSASDLSGNVATRTFSVVVNKN